MSTRTQEFKKMPIYLIKTKAYTKSVHIERMYIKIDLDL
jgi:hypothetical protein